MHSFIAQELSFLYLKEQTKSLHETIYHISNNHKYASSYFYFYSPLSQFLHKFILCIFSQKLANFEAFKVSTYLFIHGEKFFANLDIIGCYCSVFRFRCIPRLNDKNHLGDSSSMWYQQELRMQSWVLLLHGLSSISFHSYMYNEARSACMSSALASSKHFACLQLHLLKIGSVHSIFNTGDGKTNHSIQQ